MNFESWFSSKHPGISVTGAQTAIALHQEGATIPFIARYRKEKTGNLQDFEIEKAIEANEAWTTLIKRKAFVADEIEKQGKLTPELKAKIEATFDPDILEDLYLPYRKKKKTKAEQAREAGIQPLADWIWNCADGTETPLPGQTLIVWATTFRNEEKGFKETEQVLEGAKAILVERLSEMADLRDAVRRAYFEKGLFRCQKGEKAGDKSKFERFFDYWETVQSLMIPKNSHRYLAIRRGKQEKELSVSLEGPLEDAEFSQRLLQLFHDRCRSQSNSPGKELLSEVAKSAFSEHVFPAIETEILKALKAVADTVAIEVFSTNLSTNLLSPPFGPRAVLGIDPGIRTGCKAAVVGSAGQFISTELLYFETEDQKKQATTVVLDLVQKNGVEAVAIGNGTHGRETEKFIRTCFKESSKKIPIVSVSEAGASVYSASETAREEFPDLDVTVRGAISIARRLQDPLAELVKVDPKSLGVGQYQHDVNQNELKKSLTRIVEYCVNSVGVNVNTASYHLLSYVSGIGEAIAKNIVKHRVEKGLFNSRQALMEVPNFSAKTFEQAAGFLRVPESENPLDNTGVHPERYAVLENFAKKVGKTVGDLVEAGTSALRENRELEAELGAFTLRDIIEELECPGRDPRESFTPVEFREDISELKDVKPGMICPGVVTNVTNFGCFVDIGVHQDGLVHLSQISEKFISDPKEVVSPGHRVTVKVLEVDLEKKQMALSIKEALRVPRPKPLNRRPPPKPKRPPKPKFAHNPFAALADLKRDLKK